MGAREESKDRPVHVAGIGGSYRNIAGLIKGEGETLERMVQGLEWATVEKGRLISQPKANPLPGPVDDEDMFPFWRPWRAAGEKGEGVQTTMVEFEKVDLGRLGPSFFIQSLCAYDYTPENYRKEVEKLGSWGFECMRSRRGPDGKYWEIWYLPGLWAARGGLKECVPNDNDVAGAVEFIRRNARFGAMDLAVQRLCTVLDPD